MQFKGVNTEQRVQKLMLREGLIFMQMYGGRIRRRLSNGVHSVGENVNKTNADP